MGVMNSPGNDADNNDRLNRDSVSTGGGVGFLPSALAAVHAGDSLRTSGGALSAPPPGFGNSSGPEDRSRKANQLLWNDGTEAAATSDEHQEVLDQRTRSYTNLAAVLGTSLTESMDVSTREQKLALDTVDGPLLEMFDPAKDLSYTRQSRHAASRLIGSSSNRPDSPGSRRVEVPEESPAVNLGGVLKRQVQGDRLNRSAGALQGDPLNRSSGTPTPTQRQSTPLGMFTTNRALPPKDLGLTVIEPIDSRRSAPPDFNMPSGSPLPQIGGLERGMQQLSVEEARRSPFETPVEQLPLDMSQRRKESELLPFIWDVGGTEPSRSLVIMRASSLYVPDIRSTCEAFGVLEAFRSDFSEFGIIFVSFFDLRSAQYAALELQSCLKRLATSEWFASQVRVQYCVPLNASSALDESTLRLSEVPSGVGEEILSSILSSYGAVRSFRSQPPQYGSSSYAVEFHNVQDAKQALLELETTQPWGPSVIVEVGTRTSVERRRGRELLALIGRWRQSLPAARQAAGKSQAIPPVPPHISAGGRDTRSPSSSSASPVVGAPDAYGQYPIPGIAQESPLDSSSSSRGHPAMMVGPDGREPSNSSHLMLGPDGRYSYMVVNHTAYLPGHDPSMQVPGGQQHVVHGPHGAYVASGPPQPRPGTHHHPPPSSRGPPAVHYWQHATPAPHQYHVPSGATVATNPSYATQPPLPGGSSPYYAHVGGMPNPTDSSISGSSGSNQVPAVAPPRRHAPSLDDKDNRHLMLSLEAVESGRDTRTSLMVRNIPNKYTQHMLLSELTENGHGPGKIDFFYLPIDFKNRCNRGYAFVNFVDYRDIVPFHAQYFGQHWKVFNSDKICDITYARIQGKAGMLKRFENSALMEKDDEYKPLVFVSNGVDRGKRIPFP